MSEPRRYELIPHAAQRDRYRYGPWHIEHEAKPIPTRAFDWDWWHDDYDGDPDARDYRCGRNPSLESAIAEIHEHEDDEQ